MDTCVEMSREQFDDDLTVREHTDFENGKKLLLFSLTGGPGEIPTGSSEGLERDPQVLRPPSCSRRDRTEDENRKIINNTLRSFLSLIPFHSIKTQRIQKRFEHMSRFFRREDVSMQNLAENLCQLWSCDNFYKIFMRIDFVSTTSVLSNSVKPSTTTTTNVCHNEASDASPVEQRQAFDDESPADVTFNDNVSKIMNVYNMDGVLLDKYPWETTSDFVYRYFTRSTFLNEGSSFPVWLFYIALFLDKVNQTQIKSIEFKRSYKFEAAGLTDSIWRLHFIKTSIYLKSGQVLTFGGNYETIIDADFLELQSELNERSTPPPQSDDIVTINTFL